MVASHGSTWLNTAQVLLNTPSNTRLQPVIFDIADAKHCSTLRCSWLALTWTSEHPRVSMGMYHISFWLGAKYTPVQIALYVHTVNSLWLLSYKTKMSTTVLYLCNKWIVAYPCIAPGRDLCWHRLDMMDRGGSKGIQIKSGTRFAGWWARATPPKKYESIGMIIHD